MPVLSNAKHELFAQAMAKGETADSAYVSAGFKENRGNAIRLKANERVQSRVAEIKSRAAAKVEITVADIAKQLDEDRQFARENASASAAVAATMGKAKVLGLLIEKQQVTGADGGPIQSEHRMDLSSLTLEQKRALASIKIGE